MNDNLHDGEIKAHLEANWKIFKSTWTHRTLRYNAQSYVFNVDAFIDFSVLCSCGHCGCLLLSTFLYASGCSCRSWHHNISICLLKTSTVIILCLFLLLHFLIWSLLACFSHPFGFNFFFNLWSCCLFILILLEMQVEICVYIDIVLSPDRTGVKTELNHELKTYPNGVGENHICLSKINFINFFIYIIENIFKKYIFTF